jgi:hypothetical protein
MMQRRRRVPVAQLALSDVRRRRAQTIDEPIKSVEELQEEYARIDGLSGTADGKLEKLKRAAREKFKAWLVAHTGEASDEEEEYLLFACDTELIDPIIQPTVAFEHATKMEILKAKRTTPTARVQMMVSFAQGEPRRPSDAHIAARLGTSLRHAGPSVTELHRHLTWRTKGPPYTQVVRANKERSQRMHSGPIAAPESAERQPSSGPPRQQPPRQPTNSLTLVQQTNGLTLHRQPQYILNIIILVSI